MRKFLITLLLFVSVVLNAQNFADVFLTWSNNHPSQFVSKYIIYQATGDTSTNYVPVVTVTGTNVAKVRVNSTTTSYGFKVAAQNGVGISALSDATRVPTNSPTTPTNLSVLKIQ